MKKYITLLLSLVLAHIVNAQRSRTGRMEISLNRIDVCDSIMRFDFHLRNLSAVRYVPARIEYIIADKRAGKRTAQQQRNLETLASDPLRVLAGNARMVMRVIFPAFILHKGKEMRVRISEAEGARSITLRIPNRKLLHAKKSEQCTLQM